MEKCKACGEEFEVIDLVDDGLCNCCADLNYWAQELGYAELRRCLDAVEALGEEKSDGTD